MEPGGQQEVMLPSEATGSLVLVAKVPLAEMQGDLVVELTSW